MVPILDRQCTRASSCAAAFSYILGYLPFVACISPVAISPDGSSTSGHGTDKGLAKKSAFGLLRRDQQRQESLFFPQANASRGVKNLSMARMTFMRHKGARSHAGRWTPIEYNWTAAQAREFHKLEKSVRHPSARVEYTWQNGLPHKCGTPCVAHCVAGLTKKASIDTPQKRSAEWNIIKNMIARFSHDPVVFLVLSIAENKDGHDPQEATYVNELRDSIDILNPARALFEASKCDTHDCLLRTSRIGLCMKEYWQCDLQIGRVGQCMELITGYEKDHSMRFDFVTRIRADPKDGFIRDVTAFPTDRVSMARWEGRRCYGGFDWVYVMPREFAEVIGRFRDEATCDIIQDVNKSAYKGDGLAVIGGYHDDPLYRAPLFSCDGCEAWLAAWMWKHRIPFEPQPPLEDEEKRCRKCSYPSMCSLAVNASTTCVETKLSLIGGVVTANREAQAITKCLELPQMNRTITDAMWCPKSPLLS